MKAFVPVLIAAALVASCSKKAEEATNTVTTQNVVTTTETVTNTAAPAPVAAVGFDPATAPVANPTLGAWPYFSIMDGYTRFTRENKPGDSAKDYLKDVAFDRYEFFDGVKLIPVEGRLVTYRADGKGASWFQVQKTYEKLVHDLGGVTVFEGKGGAIMAEKKMAFAEKRHRAFYLEHDEQGVYMIKTPTTEIWVEVYKPWNTTPDNYWLTVVEKKGLEVKASILPADEMKKALDATGHVALYVNFDTDKSTLRPDASPTIGEIAKLLQANPALKLTVEGHTDNQGAAPHNQQLSEGRANAVVGALIGQGIAYDRLQPKGFGQTKPIADNATEDGRAKNRRVELVKR